MDNNKDEEKSYKDYLKEAVRREKDSVYKVFLKYGKYYRPDNSRSRKRKP